MKTRTLRRLSSTLGAAALVGATLVTPTAANAVPVLAEDAATETGQCQVDQATLGWGMKESFRTYITGSIAQGSWELGEGVQYVDPVLDSSGVVEPGTNLFQWSGGAGELASTLEGGTVSFDGSVHFTGHNGALSVNIGDPAIEFADADTAYLLLAIGEAAAGEEVPQVKAAKIELTGFVEADGETLTVAGAPAILTADGAAAFNGDYGTYASGDAMDPVYLDLTATGCELGAAASEIVDEEGGAEEHIVTVQEEQQEFPWLPVVVGGVALVVIAVAVTLLITGRSKKPSAAGGSGAGEDPTP